MHSLTCKLVTVYVADPEICTCNCVIAALPLGVLLQADTIDLFPCIAYWRLWYVTEPAIGLRVTVQYLYIIVYYRYM